MYIVAIPIVESDENRSETSCIVQCQLLNNRVFFSMGMVGASAYTNFEKVTFLPLFFIKRYPPVFWSASKELAPTVLEF